jgi:hypothetical protein
MNTVDQQITIAQIPNTSFFQVSPPLFGSCNLIRDMRSDDDDHEEPYMLCWGTPERYTDVALIAVDAGYSITAFTTISQLYNYITGMFHRDFGW